MTLGELATRVGVSAATLSRAETGSGRLTTSRIALCAEALGIEVASLQCQDGEEPLELVADGPANIRGLFVPTNPVTPGSWRQYEPLILPAALDSALRCFLELGYHGASVRDIAERAQLSVPGLYHHYPSKQDLLVAVMDMLTNDLFMRCEAARAEGNNAVERFLLVVESFALFHTYRRDWAFIGLSEMRSLDAADRSRIAAIRTACKRMIDDEVRQLVVDGIADLEEPEDASRAVVMMLVGIANWYRIDGPVSPEETARRYVALGANTVRLDALKVEQTGKWSPGTVGLTSRMFQMREARPNSPV